MSNNPKALAKALEDNAPYLINAPAGIKKMVEDIYDWALDEAEAAPVAKSTSTSRSSDDVLATAIAKVLTANVKTKKSTDELVNDMFADALKKAGKKLPASLEGGWRGEPVKEPEQLKGRPQSNAGAAHLNSLSDSNSGPNSSTHRIKKEVPLEERDYGGRTREPADPRHPERGGEWR